jgi:DNA polymerase/3'-5' exonuclease PolX
VIATDTKPRFAAAEARTVAERIVAALSPFCERIEIAGSLRRGKPTVGDVEILYVPKAEDRPDGLFGSKPASLADERIEQALADGAIVKRPSKAGIFTWGEKNKLAVHVASGIPVDFFGTTLENWWVSLVVRTGSAEMNLELTTTAQRQGRSLLAYGCGVRQPDGMVIAATSERAVFEMCGVAYREPHQR